MISNNLEKYPPPPKKTQNTGRSFALAESYTMRLSCHPINFLWTRGVRARKEAKPPVFTENVCCYFLEEASAGVRRCLRGGLLALCTTSPSLPRTGIWWQTGFNLPAMSSWVQLLIAGCGGVACPVEEWVQVDGYDSERRRYGFLFLSAARVTNGGRKIVGNNEETASELWGKTDRYLGIM